jgi:methionyl-tRNA formyltransferase
VTRPRVALACATRRGYLFLDRLTSLRPDLDLVVVSFPGAPWEPPFLDDIRRLAVSRNARFFESRKLETGELREIWSSAPPDVMLFVNWRYLVPKTIYGLARLGAYVIHDSLLPEYRGFSPTTWAIINGEDHTGATLFAMSDEVDAGDIVDQVRIPIAAGESIGTVLPKVTTSYLELLERNLEGLLRGDSTRTPQDHSRASYTCARLPGDNEIDWRNDTRSIYNLVRAVSAPYPGAYTSLDGRRLTVWEATIPRSPRRYVGAIPGRVAEVIHNQAVVLTGDGSLLLKRVQTDQSGDVCAGDVLNNPTIRLGT